MFGFGKRQPAPSPLTIRLRHIDMALEMLARKQPRDESVWKKIDDGLDERLDMRPAPAPVVNPGCGDIFIARTGGQCCEVCEHEVRPGEVVASQPGTGGLVQHVACPGRCVASLHIPTTGATCSLCGAVGMQHEDDHPGGGA
jgi:hypothetical protein